MTATEKLRQMLDERGVEWVDNPLMRVGGMERGTLFDSSDGRLVRVNEALDGTLCASHLTPEQAIAATLGIETCHNAGVTPYIFVCSECGASHLRNRAFIDMPNYCPDCGRRVVQ